MRRTLAADERRLSPRCHPSPALAMRTRWGGQGCTEKGIEALLAQASGHARRQSVEGLAKAQQALARALQLAERDLGASHATTL